MKLIVANESLQDRGGTETYTILTADHLQRLGHDVTVYAQRTGTRAREAREAGLRVVEDPQRLPEACDGIVSQDQVLALELAERYPGVPQAFVAHSELGLQLPPNVPGVAGAVVVLHDRLRRRVEAMALDAEVVRLHQPVDLERFYPRRPLPERPRRAVMVGNYLRGARRDVIVEAFEAAGIEWTAIGRHGDGERGDVERVMDEADIVVGKARVIVEAMACGRAAYVYDWNGCDGWVTPERYPLLESDNFGGQAEATAVTIERVRADLERYDPRMGVANRDLAVANHSAMKHAEALVRVLVGSAARPAPPEGPLEEMAWLARQNMRLEFAYAGRWAELQRLSEALEAAHTDSRRLTAERDDARSLWQGVQDFRTTRRYRLAEALARPLDLVRSLRRRRRG